MKIGRGGALWADTQIVVGRGSLNRYYHGTSSSIADVLVDVDLTPMILASLSVASVARLKWTDYTDFGKDLYVQPGNQQSHGLRVGATAVRVRLSRRRVHRHDRQARCRPDRRSAGHFGLGPRRRSDGAGVARGRRSRAWRRPVRNFPARRALGLNPFVEENNMPYVNIKITREGATAAQKARLIAGVTELLREVLGKNPATTVVVIDEVETDNWGIGGETVTARRARGS